MKRRYNNSTDRMCEEMATVPFVVLESVLYRAEKREKRLCALAFAACAVALISCIALTTLCFL